jgi:hypothetical protein
MSLVPKVATTTMTVVGRHPYLTDWPSTLARYPSHCWQSRNRTVNIRGIKQVWAVRAGRRLQPCFDAIQRNLSEQHDLQRPGSARGAESWEDFDDKTS